MDCKGSGDIKSWVMSGSFSCFYYEAMHLMCKYVRQTKGSISQLGYGGGTDTKVALNDTHFNVVLVVGV